MAHIEVGKLIKSIDKLMMRNADLLDEEGIKDKVSPMQGWIIGHLFMNQGKTIYQKDLEQEFGLPKSTLATILKQLEEKGYIMRVCAEHDSRLKAITLSEKGLCIRCAFVEHIDQINQMMCEDVSLEEIEAFLRIGKKMRQNLEDNLMRTTKGVDKRC